MLDQYYIIIMPVTPPELCSGYTKQFAGRLCACEIEKNALRPEKKNIVGDIFPRRRKNLSDFKNEVATATNSFVEMWPQTAPFSAKSGPVTAIAIQDASYVDDAFSPPR